MSDATTYIHDQLAQFRASPYGYGIRLRNYLSRIIVDGLDDRNWSQRQLADAAGMRESFLSRIIHGDSNCTFEVVGKILHALGVEPAIYDTDEFTLLQTHIEYSTGDIYGEESETIISGTFIFSGAGLKEVRRGETWSASRPPHRVGGPYEGYVTLRTEGGIPSVLSHGSGSE